MKNGLIINSIGVFGGLLITFITPILGMLMMMSFAIGLDTIFAVYYIIKKKGREHYSSHKLFNIVPKSAMYMGVILLAFMIDKFLLQGDIYDIKLLITKLVTGMFLYIEIKSIDETSQKLGNRPFIDVLKGFLDRLKGIKKDLNEIVSSSSDSDEDYADGFNEEEEID